MVQNQNIFQAYKPLRNNLKKLCLDDSFFVIWNFIQYLQFEREIDKTIEVNPRLLHLKDTRSWRPHEWELELLTKEIIINSQDTHFTSKSLKKWSYFSNTLNKLRDLCNEIAKTFIDKNNVTNEFNRIAFRQFPWQSRPSKDFLVRYYKIFNVPTLNNLVKKIIGLTVNELYFIGLAFGGDYLKKPEISIFHLDKFYINKIGFNRISKFLEFTSKDISFLKVNMIAEQEINDKFEYSYNYLRAYPIIRMLYRNEKSLVCPLPTLLFRRITSGLYYEICKEKDFGVNFGNSFQKYVGEVIEKANNNKTIGYIKEEEYHVHKNRKDTVDWIVYDRDSALFIGCKTKRMILLTKLQLNENSIIKKELDKMAEIIFQIYKSIDDYRKNLYPSFKYEQNRQIYPLILTLENWFLIGNKRLDIVNQMVAKKLSNKNLPLDYLNKMPYSICSMEEFENVIQIIQSTGIKEFMSKKVFDKEKNTWAFDTFIIYEFPNERRKLKFLFRDEADKIYRTISKYTF
jgi:hypothetical protein